MAELTERLSRWANGVYRLPQLAQRGTWKANHERLRRTAHRHWTV
jgi:hypothetical protein